MARRIGVELIGDGASLEKAFLNSGTAAKVFAQTTVKASATAAEARVAASAKQIAALRADSEAFSVASASYVRGSDEQIAASKLLVDTQHRLQLAMGETSLATRTAGGSAASAEREVGRFTRGALAGSGVVRGLGRSLAFATGGFLAFAGIASVIRNSIEGAESLKKAEESLAVAVEHTGGSLGKLEPKYEAVARAAQQFGINQADALTGLARATVLTGNAAKAQRAYEEALVISKATGKDFNAVLTATSKGQIGVTTSLQRYGILVAKGTDGTKQFESIMARFGGQAAANTSQSDKFNAILANTEEIIGTTLLPTVNQYLGELGNWLQRMNQSGRLQKDVNTAVHDGVAVFRAIGTVVHTVDRVTGSFVHTLELLAAFKLASLVTGWIGSLQVLAAQWGFVGAAATAAGTAEAGALAGGGVAGIARGVAGAEGVGGAVAGAGIGAAALARLRGRGGTSAVTGEVGQYAGATTRAEGATKRFTRSLGGLKTLGLLPLVPVLKNIYDQEQKLAAKHTGRTGKTIFDATFGLAAGGVGIPSLVDDILGGGSKGKPIPVYFSPQFVKFGGKFTPAFFPPFPEGQPGRTQKPGPFGSAKPRFGTLKTFQVPINDQIGQAQAALSKTMADDVAAAKKIIAFVRKLIDQGRLKGPSLLAALQEEASALSVVQSAQDQAQQRASAAAAKAKAAADKLKQFEIPINLQVEQARLEAFGKNETALLKKIIAAAKAAIASGRLGAQGLINAYNAIGEANQQLREGAGAFTLPLKLQLAEAKAQALGKSLVPALKKEKAAAEKALKSGKLSIQGQIDAYNEISSVNDQLKSSTSSGMSGFRQASTRALTSGLGLDAEQRKALRARLSQLGPGGTVPRQGVGAYGYVIGDNGRPIHIHTHVEMDRKQVGRSVTRYQQRHHRRNPRQRRGPNAAGS